MICRRLSFLITLLVVAAGSLPAQTMHPTSGNPSFEQLKTLVGNWQGKDQHGNQVHLTFELCPAAAC